MPFRSSGKRLPPSPLNRTVERVSGAPRCSMAAQDVCLAGATDDGAIVRVTLSGGRSPSVYYLCHACATAGGDLRVDSAPAGC
jgi:hypothetical protein